MEDSTLTIVKEGSVNIFEFKDKLTYAKLDSIKSEIAENFSFDEGVQIIVNLSDVKILDSAGIGLIVSLYKSTNVVNGKFVIACSSTSISDILKTVGVNRIFSIHTSLDEALKSF